MFPCDLFTSLSHHRVSTLRLLDPCYFPHRHRLVVISSVQGAMESPSQFSPNEYIFWDNVKEPYEVSPDALTAMPTWMQCGANNHRVDSFSSVYHNKFDEAGQYTPTNDASMYPVALDDCPTSNTDADSSVQDEKNNPSSIAPFLVPFARNSSFVGRSDMLHWIDRSLSSSDQHNRVALTGPSGIGYGFPNP